MPFRIRARVTDKAVGVKRLAEELGGLGRLELGVFGEKAMEPHPSSELLVGQVAAVWELGLVPGQPTRSFLRAWVDANEARMREEAKLALQAVIRGFTSRKKAFETLGMRWSEQIKANIRTGGVTPPISATTARLKGHNIPLYDTHAIHNAVTYKVTLKQWKGVPQALRAVMPSRQWRSE